MSYYLRRFVICALVFGCWRQTVASVLLGYMVGRGHSALIKHLFGLFRELQIHGSVHHQCFLLGVVETQLRIRALIMQRLVVSFSLPSLLMELDMWVLVCSDALFHG